MSIIVQKYGGTSTRSYESRQRMYKNMIREVNAGNKIVAVAAEVQGAFLHSLTAI